ncbi:MAG: translational GTPase TypA, partial [Eubacteriales bacterium]|nr:translational GTPase TypA [Eubacteriales bacterium]MDD4078793.1 translational GTPase TypA [Eubacteriales bacterium]
MTAAIQENLRNIAIIAHVDHGKTTLVDGLLRQAGIFRTNEKVAERVMDSGDLERERGITILSKNTSVHYDGIKINIVDTPGHADFGGEVERVLRMVDGALLLVDAFEGPMAQTKFVLRKALERNLRIIVVINKIDRPDARPDEVLNEIFDLFVELDAADWQLDFPVIYAEARKGTASLDYHQPGADLKPLFEMMIAEIPAPTADVDGLLQMQINTLDYDDYVGRIAIGRIRNGQIRAGQQIALCKQDGTVQVQRIGKLWTYDGLRRVEAELAKAGDIVAIAGLGDINIGETISDPDNPQPLPLLEIDEPTMTMTFLVNDSPFAGREGRFVTSRQLRARLFKEAETNVSLRVEETDSPDAFQVSGRGELHLGVLVETLRREGYELQISKPKPILKEINGKIHEPYERVFLILPENYSGKIIENLGSRRGEMVNMQPSGEVNLKLEFLIPARGLIGFRSELLTETRGEGIMNYLFDHYGPWKGEIPGRRHGVLVGWEPGEATTYGLYSIESRGVLFIQPNDKVYAGMIVGENSREEDIDVNVCKKKHLTNFRAVGSEEAMRLATPT